MIGIEDRLVVSGISINYINGIGYAITIICYDNIMIHNVICNVAT